MQDKIDAQDSCSFRNELIKILQNDDVNVLILGEQHDDDLARQCIGQNIDCIAEISKTRPIVVLMEHLGENKSQYYAGGTCFMSVNVKHEVKLSLENSQLSEPLQKALEICSHYGEQYAQLAKVCIEHGIEIGGLETDRTGNCSAFSNYLDRLVSGDEAFTEAIYNRVNGVDKPLVISLCGLAHTFGVKSKLADKGLKVVAAAVTLTTSGNSSYLYNGSNNEVLAGVSPIVKNYTDQFNNQLDLVCRIDTSVETQYRPKIVSTVETELETEIDTGIKNDFKKPRYNMEKIVPFDIKALIAAYGSHSFENTDDKQYRVDNNFIFNDSKQNKYDGMKSFHIAPEDLEAQYQIGASSFKIESPAVEEITKYAQNSPHFFNEDKKVNDTGERLSSSLKPK